ncbi:DUF3570 domain-containing protein [Akkermansiaceae bacterium]|nr:DUF3570 domain-containing protein [Akkermansiaceae bacterium]
MSHTHRKLFPALPLLASTSASEGQDLLRYKYQYYDEQDGRVDVQSHYLDYRHSFGDWAVGLRLAVDSLSGETPTGIIDRRDSNDPINPGDPRGWEFAKIQDDRYVTVITLEKEIDDHTLTFEYARSEENDYLSNALALKWKRQFNENNTTMTAGVSAAFDKVRAAGFLFEDENKDTLELSVGFSQLLSTRTILDVTLGYGHSSGYLADPYRAISQAPFIFPTPENRPQSQNRWVAKVAARHYFPNQKAALFGSYRFFANNESLVGHTFELKWIQQITDQFSVTPYLRYYQQTASEYYTPTLDNANFIGDFVAQGKAPFFSPDYRLSAFDAITYGLKFTYEASQNLSLDLQLERYEMSGRSTLTPDIFFPSANVISIGANYTF